MKESEGGGKMKESEERLVSLIKLSF